MIGRETEEGVRNLIDDDRSRSLVKDRDSYMELRFECKNITQVLLRFSHNSPN